MPLTGALLRSAAQCSLVGLAAWNSRVAILCRMQFMATFVLKHVHNVSGVVNCTLEGRGRRVRGALKHIAVRASFRRLHDA